MVEHVNQFKNPGGYPRFRLSKDGVNLIIRMAAQEIEEAEQAMVLANGLYMTARRCEGGSRFSGSWSDRWLRNVAKAKPAALTRLPHRPYPLPCIPSYRVLNLLDLDLSPSRDPEFA
jgi:hypothetical protein